MPGPRTVPMRAVLFTCALLAACGVPEAPGGGSPVLEIVSGPPDSGVPLAPLADPVTLRATRDGEPAAGVTVRWRVAEGEGTVIPDADASDADGLVRARWTLGPLPGRHTLVAAIDGEEPLSASTVARGLRLDVVDNGDLHTCGLQDGRAQCSDGPSWPTTPYFAAYPADAIATGSDNVCVAAPARAPRCSRLFGEGDAPAGTELAGVPPLRELSAEFGGFCGLARADSTAWCWSFGFGAPEPVAPPRQVSPSLRFARIASGGEVEPFACGLTADGEAYCWGEGRRGQLGDGTRASRPDPRPVAGALRFRAIAAGATHACAIATDGAVHCWGDGVQFLPDPTVDRIRDTPTRIAGLQLVALAAAQRGNIGLAAGGEVWTWGSGRFPAPARVAELERLRVTDVTAGGRFCARAATRDVYCGVYTSAGPDPDDFRPLSP